MHTIKLKVADMYNTTRETDLRFLFMRHWQDATYKRLKLSYKLLEFKA